MTAQITFSLAGSGGLGKSSTARAVAQALADADAGYRVVLVDANPGQQSQRAFLGVDDDRGLEDMRFVEDPYDGLVMPGDMPHGADADFALLPGPCDPRGTGLVGQYGDAILRLVPVCDFIVVDADRTDRRLWNDPKTISGGLIRPFVADGNARILFRLGQTGSQLHDGLAALDAIHRPDRTLAVSQVPIGVKPRRASDWRPLLDGLAEYGGCDQWSTDSTRMIDDGHAGWPHGLEPDWLVKAAVWCGGRESDFNKGEGNKWVYNLLHFRG